jgi:prevent-host-death family protein
MRTVGIKALKNKLSEYVRLAAAGETVLVTDRGRLVAELAPPQPGRSARLARSSLADLIRQGVVTPATRPFNGVPPPRHPIMSFEELMRELDEDRADR